MPDNFLVQPSRKTAGAQAVRSFVMNIFNEHGLLFSLYFFSSVGLRRVTRLLELDTKHKEKGHSATVQKQTFWSVFESEIAPVSWGVAWCIPSLRPVADRLLPAEQLPLRLPLHLPRALPALRTVVGCVQRALQCFTTCVTLSRVFLGERIEPIKVRVHVCHCSCTGTWTRTDAAQCAARWSSSSKLLFSQRSRAWNFASSKMRFGISENKHLVFVYILHVSLEPPFFISARNSVLFTDGHNWEFQHKAP